MAQVQESPSHRDVFSHKKSRHAKFQWILRQLRNHEEIHTYIYNPGQKYVVHLENLLSFHHHSLLDDESASFLKLGPTPFPTYNVASRGTL